MRGRLFEGEATQRGQSGEHFSVFGQCVPKVAQTERVAFVRRSRSYWRPRLYSAQSAHDGDAGTEAPLSK